MNESTSILPQSIEDFGFPITLAFAKDGRAYLSERITGRLWQVENAKYRLIKTFPIVPLIGHNETGLLGIALDPDFLDNGYIYCFYTAGTSEKDFKNKIVRIKEDGTGETVLLDDIPAGMIHDGGILVFGNDKNLYIGVGVQNEIKEKSQDIAWLGGKVLRIARDGTIPPDNPLPNSPVFSFGHRNIFGLAVHPKTGSIYASDVGPDQNDEIDLIEKGGDYGWPSITGPTKNKKFISPIRTYPHVITPTQMVVVDNDLYVGSFNEGSVHKLTLSATGEKVVKDEIVYKTKPYGVIGVFYGSDKKFYVTLPSSISQFAPQHIEDIAIKI